MTSHMQFALTTAAGFPDTPRMRGNVLSHEGASRDSAAAPDGHPSDDNRMGTYPYVIFDYRIFDLAASVRRYSVAPA
jgi:hypothetical protein